MSELDTPNCVAKSLMALVVSPPFLFKAFVNAVERLVPKLLNPAVTLANPDPSWLKISEKTSGLIF